MTSDSYNALVSPDAYAYLDETNPEELLHDEILEEQEELTDDLFDDDEETEVEQVSDSDDDAYSGTLFDFDDDELDAQEKKETPATDDSKLMFDEDDEDNLVIGKEEQKVVKELAPPKPGLLDDICAFCTDKYNDIFRYISDCSEDEASSLVEAITKARDSYFKDKKDKLFEIPNKDMSIAIINDNSDPMLYTQRLEFVAANMLLKGRGFWNLLLLNFKDNGELRFAKFVPVSRSAFSEGEWRIANNMAFKMRGMMK